jgi:hypothetical protein
MKHPGNGLWDAGERGWTPIEPDYSARVRSFCRQRFLVSRNASFSLIHE